MDFDVNDRPKDGYRWLHFDLNDPNFEPWARQTLPQTAAMALTQSETRPRCDLVESGVIMNLRGVNLNPGSNPDDMVSVRLWAIDGLIISARVRKIWAVDTIRQQVEAGKGPTSIAAFLAELAYSLNKRIEKVSLELVESTDEFEERSFAANRGLFEELAVARQSAIKLRRFVRPQAEALIELAEGHAWSLDTKSAGILKESANHALRTIEELDATVDRLRAVHDHLELQQSSAFGRNSYVLSIVAAIFLPLSFLTGLFGVNVGGMPGTGAALAFWFLTGASTIIGIALFFIFKFSKWL
jgi:zinc transporter